MADATPQVQIAGLRGRCPSSHLAAVAMTSQPHWPPSKIVSGGQTGVDRAALDTAIALGIPHGGWCPQGRLAEDGTIAPKYELTEHVSAAYDDRTRQNVQGSDGTLILCVGPPRGGTKLTAAEAPRLGKPFRIVQLGEEPDFDGVRRWASEHQVAVLNIAGPRESQCLGIGRQAKAYLKALLQSPAVR